MNLLPRYWALAFGVCLGWSAIAVAEDASQEKPASSEPLAASAADLEFFETKIRPILASRCQQCHGSEQQKGGLRLDSRARASRLAAKAALKSCPASPRRAG